MPESNFFVHVDAKADMRNLESCVHCLTSNFLINALMFIRAVGTWSAPRYICCGCVPCRMYRFALVLDDTVTAEIASRDRRSLADNVSHLGLWKMASDDPAGIRYREYFYFDFGYEPNEVTTSIVEYYTNTDIACVMELAELKKQGKYRLPAMYKGPQWWCLTRRHCGTFVLEHFDTQKHFREFFVSH